MTEENNNQAGENENEGMVSKADLDAALARSDKLEKDLEDVRMEVLTPEYQKFLDSDEKPAEKPAASDDTLSDDKFEKMSKKDLFDLAVKTARDEIQGGLTKKDEAAKADSAARTKREIAAFSSTHADFETYRPTMYGISLDPKHADKSLAQLYEAAKAHVKAIHGEPTDKQKDISRRSNNEKPGGDASSLEKLKSMSNEEIANEAFAEVEEALGDTPLT